jgi:class 3 adenylate cyclase
MTADELESLGVYDPAAEHAAERLELLEYLVSLGATADDLLEYRDGLPGLASVLAIRGGTAVTAEEAAATSGMSEDKLRRISRAAGFPDPGPGARTFAPRFPGMASGINAAESLFGEEAVLQLVRVMGSSMARVADALVSAFLVNVEPGRRDADPVGMSVARANADAVALLPFVSETLDLMLRQHLIAARRTVLEESLGAGFETQRMAVGFVDLVGSTALAQRLPMREFGAVLSEFESLAAGVVTDGGGRVVKLIGDEILFRADDALTACRIALELSARFADNPSVPAVRAGVAAGDVVLRDGDVFGPVVNLAARAVTLADAGDVVAPPAVAAAAGRRAESLGPQELKGFDDAVELCRLVPD